MKNKYNVSKGKFASVTLKKNSENVRKCLESTISSNSFEKPLYDIRVQLAKGFVAMLFLISVMGIFVADNSLNESFILTFMFLLLAACNYLGFYVLRKDVTLSLMFSLFCVYIWIAFPFKLMLAFNDPMMLWVSHSFFEPNIVSNEIAGSFIAIMPGLFFFFVGFFSLALNVKRNKQYSLIRINHIRFILIIVALMILRLFNQIFLDIGLPGVIPKAIPIPYAIGVLELLSRPVLMVLVNLYFFYVIRLSDNKAIWIALSFLLINIVLGLRVGYKSELVIQGLLLIYYLFETLKYMSQNNRRFMKIFTVSLIALMVVLYPLINHYRSYILQGKNLSEAIESAQIKTDSQSNSFALSFLNRINGIGAFYAATKLGEGRDFSVNSIFNDDAMELIKEKLYGSEKNKAVTAFGTTQFSVFYLIGGSFFLAVCSFITGWLLRLGSIFLKFKVFKSKYTFQAYLPLLCIFWVKLLASGGSLMLYMKELLLVVIFLVLLERYGSIITLDKKD